MRRALYTTVKVLPYTSGAAIDRMGYRSAILAANISSVTGSPTAAKLTVAITDCDTASGTYAAAGDARALSIGGSEYTVDVSGTTELNIPIDLIGCKRHVKITATVTYTGGTSPSSTAAYALALGDADKAPV